MSTTAALHLKHVLDELGPLFADRAAAHDSSDEFVAQNFAALREARIFSALVPEEFGGGGVSYNDMCDFVRRLGRYCGSTALTLSMHQHLVAAAVWNVRHGRPGEKLLRAVADGEKYLVSTGGNDWLSSSGTLQRCEGGFRFTARKGFASGCLAGDILSTSGQFEDPVEGWQVLHFAVPVKSEGITIDRNWQTMGMRGTGSHTVVLNDVFVPEQSVVLRRPRGAYHPVWDVVLNVALPLICTAYVGVAEAAAEVARTAVSKRGDDGVNAILLGEVENELTMTQLALDSMIANTNNLEFTPSTALANQALVRKTIIAESVRRTVEKALEAVGGSAYYRTSAIERMLRDVHAAQFHPLPTKKQQRFSGRLAMGLDPIG
jgi:acyl-CoA dehydrogenase